MKKIKAILLLLFLIFFFCYSATLNNIEPCSISFEDVKEGDKIYINDKLISSSSVTGLWPETEYSVKIVNADGSLENKKITTDSWAGIYSWKNTTTNNNKGKCQEITFYVEKSQSNDKVSGTFYDIYEMVEGQPKKSFKIFPIIPLDSYSDDASFSYEGKNLIILLLIIIFKLTETQIKKSFGFLLKVMEWQKWGFLKIHNLGHLKNLILLSLKLFNF